MAFKNIFNIYALSVGFYLVHQESYEKLYLCSFILLLSSLNNFILIW